MARSKREINETLREMYRAREQLASRPDRQQEAEGHIRLLEHVVLHGGTPGHPNLSPNAIVRRARGFLFEWNDTGFMYDDPPPDKSGDG
jgi:hypothetical protein